MACSEITWLKAVSASKLGGNMRIVKHGVPLIMNSVFEFIHPITYIIGKLLYSYLHTLSHLIFMKSPFL